MALLAWMLALILPDGVLPRIPGPTALYDNFLGPEEQEHPDPQNAAHENQDPNGPNEGNLTTGNQGDAASASEEPSSEAQESGAESDKSATQDWTRKDESGEGATEGSDSGAGAKGNRNTESGTTRGSTGQGQSGDAQSGEEAGGASDGSGSESTASDAGQPSLPDGAGQAGSQGQDTGTDAGDADDGTPGADDGQKTTSGNQSGKPKTPSEGVDQNGEPSDGPQPSGGSEGSDGGANRAEAALDDTGQGTEAGSDASHERSESANQGASQDMGASVDGKSRKSLQPSSDEGPTGGPVDDVELGGHALQPDPAPPDTGQRPAPPEIRDTQGDTDSDSVVGDPAVTQQDAPEGDVRLPIETLLPSENALEVRQEGGLFAEPGQSPSLIRDRIAAPRDTSSDGPQPPPVHQNIPAWIADILD